MVVSVRSRLEGDCWMWARLAFAAAADVAAVAAIARRGRSGEWLRSEAFLSQVGRPNPCLHTLVRASCHGISLRG